VRVMWLTQLQLPAVTGDSSMGAAGWLDGLRWALETYEPDVELGIVSWGRVIHEPRRAGQVTYFSLKGPRPATRAQRLKKAWSFQMIPAEAIDDAVVVGRGFCPDLLHVHGTEHPLGLAALRLDVPTIATLQGIATTLQRHVLGHVPPSQIARSVATRNFIRGSSYMHWYQGMKRAATTERTIIGGLRYFMGQTDWDEAVLRLLNPSAEYFRAPRVMQAPFYADEWLGPREGAVTIFCTSSPAPYKGLEIVLEALGLLRDAGHTDVRLRVAGDLPDSFIWPWLNDITKKRGLGKHVDWLGHLAADALVSELSRSSLFVLPSHIENESNALIEAMLLGVPCVAAAVGGVPSVVSDGVNGLLFHDNDPFALAAAVELVTTQPELARSLGNAARTAALSRWDPCSGARAIRSIYEHVIDPGTPGGRDLALLPRDATPVRPCERGGWK